MTPLASRTRFFELLGFRRQAGGEQQNTAARPPTLRRDQLSIALCFAAIAVGIVALTGFALGNASIASLGAGKPVALVTALAFIVLGIGLLALRSPTPAGVVTARGAALLVVVVTAADLVWVALSSYIEEWRVHPARDGVLVHPYFITGLLILASGLALSFLTTRRDFSGHVIASAALLISLVTLLGYVLKVPLFLDRAQTVAPVAAAACGLVLISAAALLARPRGWVALLLSRTSTGVMSRVLLLAIFIVPFLTSALRDLIAGTRWFTPAADYAAVVHLAEIFLRGAVVLSAGALVYKHEHDRSRLAAIVESSGDAIIGTSSDGLIESWNAGAEQMYGYTAADAIGRSVAMIAPPERQGDAPRVLERIRRDERIDPFETVRVAKDGRRIDVWLSVWPILDYEGNAVGVSTVAHDITSRKKAEEAMVESEARYRTLGENLPQKIMLKDRNSVYVSVNEAYARDLGIDPKAVAGKTDYDFFPKDLAEKYHADDARIMEAGVTEDLEEEYVERGQRRFIHTVKTPVRDPEGNVTNILVILWDITEKRLAEVQLEKAMADAVGAARALEVANRDLELQIAETRKSDEAHRRLATVVEQATETIVVTDLDGKVVYVNPAFERISGYTREEAIGQTPRILGGGMQTAEFYQELWTTINQGRVWQGHIINRRKDGSLYEEEATISPVRDASGTIINFVAIKRDVTAELALAEHFRHAQKIEAIGTLAGGVAHDFNNLLQAMLSIVQLLEKKGAESPRRVEHLNLLEKTIRRGSGLTRQLLLFARREISKQENLDLNQILRDLVGFLRRVVRANVRLSVEPASVPLWIKADRGQIEQVIMNLAVNAIDAMPEGGALSIVAGGDENAAWLKVSDTGTGIPETIRDRIFEPFFTTKEAGKGTGLGLSVAHGIITTHGGHIDVECPPEGGTTFLVELPRLSPSAAPTAAMPSEEDVPNGRGERVLLVEDEQAAREGLSGILVMLGYSVVAVGTGEAAVGIDAAVPFSVVLTDSMLPGIPGIEVVHRLRERWPEMRAILMSGYAAPEVIEAAVEADEFRFLQKPFGMADLARTLHAVLQPSDGPERP